MFENPADRPASFPAGVWGIINDRSLGESGKTWEELNADDLQDFDAEGRIDHGAATIPAHRKCCTNKLTSNPSDQNAINSAYKVAPKIFLELGAEVIVIGDRPNGLNINLDCGALHPEKMIKKVKEEKADLGIALDGDADRVVAVDEKGEFFDGDHILAMCALDMKKDGKLKKDTVVATVMSNLGFETAMRKSGIKVIKTAVGDRYVMEELKKGYSLGGEQSGHIMFTDHVTTGDGIISALQVLRLMKLSGKKLSELADCMQTYPQILVNIPVKEKKDFDKMPKVKQTIEEVNKKLGDKGRTLIRYSGTENLARIMIEGESKKEIEALAEKIAGEIRKEIGV